MAKIYSTPKGFDAPNWDDYFGEDGRFDDDKCRRSEEAWTENLAHQLKLMSPSKSPLVGEVVTFPIADGAAMYMVYNTSPCALIHMPLGDAWSIPEAHARGIRTKDLHEMVASRKHLAKLFRN